MTGLDVFALIVLLVLLGAAVAIWLILGMYPGKIAREGPSARAPYTPTASSRPTLSAR
jgi:hypothetical protein